jgi:signal transduction histidine kinase
MRERPSTEWISSHMLGLRSMNCISRAVGFLLSLLAISAGSAVLAADNKQVILLHSFGTAMKPWSDYAQGIREELNRQSPWPLTITDQSLISARYSNRNPEIAFVEYLAALFAQQPPDVIVSMGGPAVDFVQRYRGQLFPSTPMVLTVLEQRRVQYSKLTQNDAAVPAEVSYKALIENILEVLPGTRNVAVVNGASPNEQFWSNEIRKEVMPLTDRIELTFLDKLSFDDILKEAARLPPHSAILWEGMSVDAAGVVHDGDDAFKRLHAVANAPIFSYTEPLIGLGVVGGPFHAVRDTTRTMASVVVRILGGEKAGDIKMPPMQFSAPVFDWREMQRWGISESRLPQGSKIYFRDPTAWDQYRLQILLVCGVILLQGVLISGLLLERRRRVHAEVQARQRSAELAHVNRYSMAGELTATIAHELNQPLGAILTNAETAELMVKSQSPDLREIGEILADIRRDDERASEVITRLRSLLKKAPFELKCIDANEVARETARLLSAWTTAREIDLTSFIAPTPLPIKGDFIQLQQVIINLVVNATDAMSSMPSSKARITISTARHGDSAVLSVSDVGPGIPVTMLKEIFEPFFTTKGKGMGMGLSIARTIVEAHGGLLSAENEAVRGATFRVRLPLSLK